MSDLFDALDLFVNRAWRITTSVAAGSVAGFIAYLGIGGGTVALLAAAAIVLVSTTLGMRWHKRAFPLE
ncbi:hypothetical protein GCM10027193_08460 [Arenimonas aestuarii]